MDGFTFALICVVLLVILVPWVIRKTDKLLDGLFDYDDKYLAGMAKAQRELEQRKRIN